MCRVSFLLPSRLFVGEKTTTGGFAPNTLKKLNGARFTTPSGEERVVTHAIGRGVTTPTSRWYESTAFAGVGSRCMTGTRCGEGHRA